MKRLVKWSYFWKSAPTTKDRCSSGCRRNGGGVSEVSRGSCHWYELISHGYSAQDLAGCIANQLLSNFSEMWGVDLRTVSFAPLLWRVRSEDGFFSGLLGYVIFPSYRVYLISTILWHLWSSQEKNGGHPKGWFLCQVLDASSPIPPPSMATGMAKVDQGVLVHLVGMQAGKPFRGSIKYGRLVGKMKLHSLESSQIASENRRFASKGKDRPSTIQFSGGNYFIMGLGFFYGTQNVWNFGKVWKKTQQNQLLFSWFGKFAVWFCRGNQITQVVAI